MMAYALYRLPHADRYTRVEGVAQELSVCAQLDDASGFVVAPFEVTASQPIVVIRPDVVEECGVEETYRSYESYRVSAWRMARRSAPNLLLTSCSS